MTRAMIIAAALLGACSTNTTTAEAKPETECKSLTHYSIRQELNDDPLTFGHWSAAEEAKYFDAQQLAEISKPAYATLIDMVRCHPRTRAIVHDKMIGDGKINTKELGQIRSALLNMRLADDERELRASANRLREIVQPPHVHSYIGDGEPKFRFTLGPDKPAPSVLDKPRQWDGKNLAAPNGTPHAGHGQ